MYRIKNKQGPFSKKSPCRRRHYALNYFVTICSPSIRAASARFQQVLFFSAHFPGFISNALPFFLAYASQHLPMLRLRARFEPFDAEPYV